MGKFSIPAKEQNKEIVQYIHNNCTGFNGSLPESPEYDKMIGCVIFQPWEPNLARFRALAHEFAHDYNDMRLRNYESIDELSKAKASAISLLFGKVGKNPFVEPPVYVDFGCNIVVGDDFYSNFNLVVLDGSLVKIGNNAMLGPNVTINCACHPLEAKARVSDAMEFAHPVTIGDDVWIGAGVTILAGVTIGDGVVVAAGAVVSKDVPSHCVVAGVPAKVIRQLNS